MPNGSVVRRKSEPAVIVNWVVYIMAGIFSSVWNGVKHFAQQMTEANPMVLIEAVKSNKIERLRRLLRELPLTTPSQQVFQLQYLEYQELSSGWTAMMYAAALGNAECIFLLLAAGAATGHADSQGRTPLHLACKEGHAAAVQRLLDGHSDPFVEDQNAFTSLDYALKLNASNEQHVALVRAIERHGFFSGTLGMKVAKWPFRKSWESRWTIVTPRRSNPRSRPNAPTRLLMTWFKAPDSFQVMGKVWLTDATVRMSEEAGSLPEMSLSLQRAHEKPADAFCVTNTHDRHTFQLRAANDSPTARQALVAVVNTIQRRPPVVPPPSQPAPPARAGSQTAAPQARPPQPQQQVARPQRASGSAPQPSAPLPPSSAHSAAALSQHHSFSDDEAMARALQEEFNRQAGASGSAAPSDGPLGQGATRIKSDSPLAQGANNFNSPGRRSRTSSRTKRASLPSSAPAQVPAQPTGSEPEEDLCLICQEGEPTSGFLHGSSIHKCVCKGCAKMYIERKIPDCPMCREKIAQVVLNIY